MKPHVQALDCSDHSYSAIASSLLGHGRHLRSVLLLGPNACSDQQWPGQPLRSLPSMQSLTLEGAACGCVDDIIADVAGCAELQHLAVICEAAAPWLLGLQGQQGAAQPHISAAAVQALANGACRACLRSLVLVQAVQGGEEEVAAAAVHCGLPELAALLWPGLPCLQSLAMDLCMPALQVPEQQQGGASSCVLAQLAAGLAQQGVAPASLRGFRPVQHFACQGIGVPGAGLPMVEGSVGACKLWCRLWQ